MSRALLDTDIDSEILKVDPVVRRNAIAYRLVEGVLKLSTVTMMEVVRGFQRKQSLRKLQEFLSAVRRKRFSLSTSPILSWPGRSPATWSVPDGPSALPIR